MALHGLVFLGSTPVGAPVIGWISETWGPRVGMGIGGAISATVAVLAMLVIKREEIVGRLRDRRWIKPGGLPDGTTEGASMRRYDGDLVHARTQARKRPEEPAPQHGPDRA